MLYVLNFERVTYASNRQISIGCVTVDASSKILSVTKPPGLRVAVSNSEVVRLVIHLTLHLSQQFSQRGHPQQKPSPGFRSDRKYVQLVDKKQDRLRSVNKDRHHKIAPTYI